MRASPACSLVIGLALIVACAAEPVATSPCRLAIEVPPGEVGFDAEVTVRARVECVGGATPPPIVWDDGTAGPERKVKTPALKSLILRERAGVLPVSPAQGRVRVRATAGALSAEADVIAAFTQTGIPSVRIGAAVYVYGGPGGTIQRVLPKEERTEPVRDQATGFAISLAGGAPDLLPQDCHRPECHPNELANHARTRHATALTRALATPPRGHDERCLTCHTGGGDAAQPGSFVDIARTIGFWPIPARPMTIDELPRDLQRLAGVGCIACHGPARIPEPPQRPTAYGAGVCATCHDAPPRYRVVEQWRQSRMSVLRPFAHEAACSPCHTAQGFATRVAGVDFGTVAPETDEPVTCAACHDPHGPGSQNPRMLRRFDDKRKAGALCVECHRSDLGETPAARLARRLAPMAPQGDLAAGDCTTCHVPHRFIARPRTPEEEAEGKRFDELAARAQAALRRALPTRRGCARGVGPAHDLAMVGDRIALVDAEGRALGDCDGDGRFAAGEDPLLDDRVAAALYPRAYALFTALRDRSRGAHNPARTKALLEEAEKGAP